MVLPQPVGHPEAAEDPRFKDSASRHVHSADIVALLDQAFARRPLAECRTLLDSAGLTYGVVQTLEESAADPQLKADGVLVPIESDGAAPTSPSTAPYGSTRSGRSRRGEPCRRLRPDHRPPHRRYGEE
ncbi:CoA transferase [Streptomyces sp. A1-5]|nr:CoA transferase [Streptomyces sp. A1-5]